MNREQTIITTIIWMCLTGVSFSCSSTFASAAEKKDSAGAMAAGSVKTETAVLFRLLLCMWRKLKSKDSMKKYLFIITLALGNMMFASCGNRPQTPKAQAADTVQKADDQREAVRQRVEEIYTTVCDVYNAADEDMQRLSEVNLCGDFCSDDWNRCVDEIKKIDLASEGEMGFFSADYWIMGQNWQKLSFKNVQVTDVSDGKAVVKLTLHNFKDVPIMLDMVHERGNWYIDNFTDLSDADGETGKFDWKQNMKEYISEYKKP